MSQHKRWIITASGNRQLGDIQKDLAQKGFRVDQVLSEIGSITGEASDELAANLRAIPGVSDVSPDEQIDIGPPDAPVTW